MAGHLRNDFDFDADKHWNISHELILHALLIFKLIFHPLVIFRLPCYRYFITNNPDESIPVIVFQQWGNKNLPKY